MQGEAAVAPGRAAVDFLRWHSGRVALGQRVTEWNNVASSVFTPLSIDVHERSSFKAKLAKLAMRRTAISRVYSEGSVVRHTSEHVSADRSHPAYLLHFQISGRSLNHQSGRSIDLRPGDCTLVDSTRPYWLEFDAGTQFIVCRFDADALRSFVHDPDDKVATRISRDSGATRTLHRLLEVLWSEGIRTAEEAWFAEADQCILSMFSLAWHASYGRPEAARYALLRRRAEDYVEQRFADPELTIGGLARALSVSTRAIQLAFAEKGETPVGHVQKVRVAHAAKLLSTAQHSVTSVAMDCGFNDLSHFGRVFRKITGQTPRRYRDVRG